MDEIVIQKGVPIPRKKLSYQPILRKMGIGDSITVDANSSRNLGLHKPKTFISRTVTEDGKKRIRIWRIA